MPSRRSCEDRILFILRTWYNVYMRAWSVIYRKPLLRLGVFSLKWFLCFCFDWSYFWRTVTLSQQPAWGDASWGILDREVLLTSMNRASLISNEFKCRVMYSYKVLQHHEQLRWQCSISNDIVDVRANQNMVLFYYVLIGSHFRDIEPRTA